MRRRPCGLRPRLPMTWLGLCMLDREGSNQIDLIAVSGSGSTMLAVKTVLLPNETCDCGAEERRRRRKLVGSNGKVSCSRPCSCLNTLASQNSTQKQRLFFVSFSRSKILKLSYAWHSVLPKTASSPLNLSTNEDEANQAQITAAARSM